MQPLRDRIAIVTGASRGGGRGIAVELGAAGATVYVTGRSTRESPATSYAGLLAQAGRTDLPGNIDQTAEEVTSAGGRGIPVRCDHTDEAQVRELIARVIRDEDRLDLLVNNAWGAHETFTPQSLNAPFWEQSLDSWDSMFQRGVRNHLLSCRAAAPLFVKQKRGLIVTTTFWDQDRYLKGNLFYDLAKSGMNRLAFGPDGQLYMGSSNGGIKRARVVQVAARDFRLMDVVDHGSFTGAANDLAVDVDGRIYVADHTGTSGTRLAILPPGGTGAVQRIDAVLGRLAGLAFGRGVLQCDDLYITDVGGPAFRYDVGRLALDLP